MPLSHSNLLCRYHYDPTDRLSGQTRTNSADRLRFYSKSRLATEIEGALRHSIVQHDDWVLAQRRRQGDTLDSTLLGADQQSSVLLTLKANEQLRHVAYSPYGHRQDENGLTSLLGFKGQRPDPVTGYYLLGNGHRAFNPTLMRFNSPDSLSPFGKGGLNPYVYCLWDPVNRDDPTGQFSIHKFTIPKPIAKFFNRLFGRIHKTSATRTRPKPSPNPSSNPNQNPTAQASQGRNTQPDGNLNVLGEDSRTKSIKDFQAYIVKDKERLQILNDESNKLYKRIQQRKIPSYVPDTAPQRPQMIKSMNYENELDWATIARNKSESATVSIRIKLNEARITGLRTAP